MNERPDEAPIAASGRLRVLIVDGDPGRRARARRLLADVADLEIAGEAGSAAEARAALAERAPELLLLDLQLAQADAFTLLELAAPHPAFVFVTAFEPHVVRALEEHACDYLLRPFGAERLRAVVERARRDLARPADERERRLSALRQDLTRNA